MRPEAGLENVEILMLLDNPCDPDMRVLREADAFADAGARVTILAWQREGPAQSEEKRAGVKIVRVPPATQRQLGWRQVSRLLGYYRNAWRELSLLPKKPRVVIAHDLMMLPLGVVVAKRFRATLVYDAHEVYRFMDAGRLPEWWLKSASRIERILIDHAVDLFVTVSRQRVDEYWSSRVHQSPVIVGNWYDVASVDPKAARKKFGLEHVSGRLIGYAGGIEGARKLDLLIEVARRRKDVHVVIAGRGNAEVVAALEAEMKKLENATFLGWISDPIDLLGACDAIYYALDPDQAYARFAAPNTLYIAMAVDRPLLAAAGGEVEWMAGHSPGVVLVEKPDADLLCEAIDRLPGPGCWGSLRREYTWREAASRYVKALERLVA